jgi:NAD-binding of NADP-dependent 3-hydroxyisobutyrate dehydrogenase
LLCFFRSLSAIRLNPILLFPCVLGRDPETYHPTRLPRLSSRKRYTKPVNLLLGLHMQAIAEAVSLGEHLQINLNVLLDVLSKTAVIAPAMVGKILKIKESDYAPQFPLRLMSKDMDPVMDAARKSGADLPAASVAKSILASNLRANGDLDLSAITPFVLGQGTRIAV